MRCAWGNHLNPKGWEKSHWESISNHIKCFLVWNNIRNLQNLALGACSSPVVTWWMPCCCRHSTAPTQFHYTPRTTMWGTYGCFPSKRYQYQYLSVVSLRSFWIHFASEKYSPSLRGKLNLFPSTLPLMNSPSLKLIQKNEHLDLRQGFIPPELLCHVEQAPPLSWGLVSPF